MAEMVTKVMISACDIGNRKVAERWSSRGRTQLRYTQAVDEKPAYPARVQRFDMLRRSQGPVTTYQNSDAYSKKIPANTKSNATITTVTKRTMFCLIASTFLSATKSNATIAKENTPGMKAPI